MHEQPYDLYELPRRYKFILYAGVILPIVSITVEALTYACAEEFVDPIPTVWHLLLVLFVPLAQLQAWFAIRRGAPDRLMLASLTNAVVIGITFFYTIVFLPVMPLAALMVFIVFGFLPLAPMFSLIAALLVRRHLRRIAATASQKNSALTTRALLAGLVFTFVVIAIIELPATLTGIGLQKATAALPGAREQGIRFLRKYGNKDVLLRSCYNPPDVATDLIGFALSKSVTPQEAQQIYYLVTGQTFDSAVPPARMRHHLEQRYQLELYDYHEDLKLDGKLNGLSLASSELQGSVDANGGVGYMQWTLAFQNDAVVQREARAEVQLPPGGIVSRLTLWDNGEEREAAFLGRSQIGEAYQPGGIPQQRYPVSVTTSGGDRVLVEYFPVQPYGETKIRVGITVPLVLEDVEHVRLLLPHFVDRNFRIPDNVNHSVWIESSTPIVTWDYSLKMDRCVTGTFSLRGELADAAISQPESSVRLEKLDLKETWSRDPFNPAFVVRQSIEDRTPAHLRRIVIVIDTSGTMRPWVPAIVDAIRSLPPDFDVKILFASSDVMSTAVRWPGTPWFVPEGAFEGGADNEPALRKAWDLAAEAPGNNAIVWIHSPQRLLFGSADDLRGRWERSYGPTLYSVQTTIGADEIEKKLDGINEVKSVARVNGLQTDLENLFARLTGRTKTLEFVRSSKKLDSKLDLSGTVQTSNQLARLWANDEVTRILAPQDVSLNNAASTLAVRYRLVTPVSRAVFTQ
ncbi:MAG TPA: hypothetical protein VF088_14515 [Pyrinomonadaceae bacterium]